MAKITLSVNNEDFGTIEGEVNVIKGEKAIYTAIPNTGYHFVKWNDENTDNPHEIEVNDNLNLSAIFEEGNATAIKAVENGGTNKTIKTIKDGQIVIIRDNVMHDLSGRKL